MYKRKTLQTSDFMYAAAPFAAFMMTYGTLSPRLGALPASLFLILENIHIKESGHSYDTNIFSLSTILNVAVSGHCG